MSKPVDLQIRVSKICCIGAGCVGGSFGAVMAYKCPDIQVTVVDTSAEKITHWSSDKLSILEPEMVDIVKSCCGQNLFFSTNVDRGIKEAELIFICETTQTKTQGLGKGKACDLKNIESAARRIAEVAQNSKIVVEKCTVPVKTAESITTILLANAKPGVSYQVLSNPEFSVNGITVSDLLNPDRVLIGCDLSKEGIKAMKTLSWVYEHWIPKQNIITTNIWSSELSKLAANAFLAQRISSYNAISILCEVTGVNIEDVAKAVGSDSRIRPLFLNTNIGFGGNSFQRDVLNIVYLCECLHLPEIAAYWQEVIAINDYHLKHFTERIVNSMFTTVSNKRIAILGFALHDETETTRELAAIYISKYLLEEKANICIYDPKVSKKKIVHELTCHTAPKNPEKVQELVSVCRDPYTAAEGSHAIVLCSDCDEFKTLDYGLIFNKMLKPAFIFDGHSILNHKKLMDIGFQVQITNQGIHSAMGKSQ